MEVLSPSLPPSPSVFRYGAASGWSSPSVVASPSSDRMIFVAVGKSPEKTLSLLRWTFRRYGCAEIGLLHIHQPSPVIPTLLGMMPVSQVNEEMVMNFRKLEKEVTNNILTSYHQFCLRSKVQANIIVSENEQVNDGIRKTVEQLGIRRLVIGSMPVNCLSLKASSSKPSNLAKIAPAFCEILFVNKGRLIWTREARATTDDYSTGGDKLTKGVRCFSYNNYGEPIHYAGGVANNPFSVVGQRERYFDMNEYGQAEALSRNSSVFGASWPDDSNSQDSSRSPSDAAVDVATSSSVSKKREFLHHNLKEIILEIDGLKEAGFVELVKRREIDLQVQEALAMVKSSQSATKHEFICKDELHTQYAELMKDHDVILHERDQAFGELNAVMKRVATLDSQAEDLSLCIDQAAAELEIIQSSIEYLRSVKPNYPDKDNEDAEQVSSSESDDRETSSLNTQSSTDSYGLSHKIMEITYSDLQSATCGFTGNFIVRNTGHACYYKGEMNGRTVIVKKLHRGSTDRSQMQFQREVEILSKLRHPNIVALVGVCPEALSLIFEHLPYASLEDRLLCKNGCNSALSWKDRTRIIAEISKGLYYMHNYKHGSIVHGDLDLDKIFLDSESRAKICKFDASWIFSEDSAIETSQSFLTSALVEPECLRAEPLSPKLDVYSFGIIILQLITGKTLQGIENEVRRMLAAGKLASVLDPAAGAWPIHVAVRFAEIGLQLCAFNARDRPKLTLDIVQEMEELSFTKEREAPSYFLCPILKEVMLDPQIAADGFSYEGQAVRRWLIEGGEASPVTNTKLKHRNLIPNHALRIAIEEWRSTS